MAQTDLINEGLLGAYHDELMTQEIAPVKQEVADLISGEKVAGRAETLDAWDEQKALAKENINDEVVRTSGGDVPLETSEGSKIVSIKPTSDYGVKFLFNSSYNQLKAAKWGNTNSQPLVGGTLTGGCYFLVPELVLGEFGTAAENNGLLFTLEDGTNIHPTVYFKPLGSTAPTSLTDGTAVTPTAVSYDGKTYYSYESSGAGWFILTYPSGKTMDDICAHIAWEDWYDKYVGLDAEDDPTQSNYNPEAAIGVLMLEGLLEAVHTDKVLRYVNDAVRDWIEFGETSAIAHHLVDIKTTVAGDWTNTEIDTGVYLHTASVGSAMKSGGAACLLDGTDVEVEGTNVSFEDSNATVSGDKLSIKYERATEETITKAYTDSVFTGSNIDTTSGKMNINDCGIEANVGATGTAETTMRYALNIVDAVAINASVNVPEMQEQIGEHEERLDNIEENMVTQEMYCPTLGSGTADDLRGTQEITSQYLYRPTNDGNPTGDSVREMVKIGGESVVWNQLNQHGNFDNGLASLSYGSNVSCSVNGDTLTITTSAENTSVSMDTNILCSAGKWMFVCFMKDEGTWGNRLQLVKGGTGVDDVRPQVGNTNWQRLASIYDNTSSSTGTWKINFVSRYAGTKQIRCVMLINLTLMGCPSSYTTVQQVEDRLRKTVGLKDYYDYNEGTIINSRLAGVESTGYNWLDVNGSRGVAKLIGGISYTISGTFTSAKINNVDVTLDQTGSFTPTADAELVVLGCDTTTVVRKTSAVVRTGDQPFKRNSKAFDVTTITGINSVTGERELIAPDGLRSAGSVQDVLEFQGGNLVFVKKVGSVDLGSLTWAFSGADSVFKAERSDNGIANNTDIINTKYAYIGYTGAASVPDKAMSGGTYGTLIFVKDSSYTDLTISAFRASLNGVYANYVLDQPITYTQLQDANGNPVTTLPAIPVDKDGTESTLPQNVNGIVSVAPELTCIYSMAAKQTILELPDTYKSIADFNTFGDGLAQQLNAMLTANSLTGTFAYANGAITYSNS